MSLYWYRDNYRARLFGSRLGYPPPAQPKQYYCITSILVSKKYENTEKIDQKGWHVDTKRLFIEHKNCSLHINWRSYLRTLVDRRLQFYAVSGRHDFCFQYNLRKDVVRQSVSFKNTYIDLLTHSVSTNHILYTVNTRTYKDSLELRVPFKLYHASFL